MVTMMTSNSKRFRAILTKNYISAMIIANLTLKLEKYSLKKDDNEKYKQLSVGLMFDTDSIDRKIDSIITPIWLDYLRKDFVAVIVPSSIFLLGSFM